MRNHQGVSVNAKAMLLWTASIMTAAVGLVWPVSAATVDHNLNYTYIYFEHGYPTPLRGRRPQEQANLAARANPDLVVQTGFYSLKLDCDDMKLSGCDALSGSDYITALNEDVTVFSPADLLLRVEKDGVRYTCTSGIVQDRRRQYVRLIESGRFVQRFDHMGLVFSADDGDVLEKLGRLEVTAWPDHLVLCLDLSDVPGITRTEIQLTSPSGRIHRSATKEGRAVLALQPHLDREYGALDAPPHVGGAWDLKTGHPLAYRFDEEEYGLHIDLPIEPVRFPADTNRVDEFAVVVRNPSKSPRSIPLIFDEVVPRAITGTSMVLCEQRDGRPTGIPVQISKNWHRDRENRSVHEGPWLRGYTMVPLAAGETRRFRLRVVYGYWGGVAAVSHAQLCLIGWGGNWKWDESALGCWGESMTYDPTQHLGAAFIDDVRPALTTNKSGSGTHGWTENVGGGDFLVYYDNAGTFHWAKRLKTAYRWTGPNMAEVLYCGVTDDDKIRFTYTIRFVRTNDYHRRFHAYRYEFAQDVVSPARLVFHQMAADYYKTVDFDRFCCGDENGLRSTHLRQPGLKGYVGPPIPFDHSWLAIDDTTCNDGATKARRGILSLASTLNGEPFPCYLHVYSPKGSRWLFDLSSDSVSRSYAAGDVVEGELEFVLPPKSVDDYWGTDREFAGRLKTFGGNAWQAVADEYRHNARLSLTLHQGTLLGSYPVEIRAASAGGKTLADFTINRGGIGHVPVILRGVPKGCPLRVQRHLDKVWVPLESVDLEQNDYYQAVQNAEGTLDCVFNVNRPSKDLGSSWRVRVLKGAVAD